MKYELVINYPEVMLTPGLRPLTPKCIFLKSRDNLDFNRR